MGDAFEVGCWNNGSEVQVDEPDRRHRDRRRLHLLMLPTSPVGAPWRDEFDWKFVNYAPIVTLGALLLLTIWWHVSAKNWFTGPDPARSTRPSSRPSTTDG